MPYTLSWEERAAEKRADVLSKIRPAWRLSDEDLARAKKQRDLTGPFIHSFLHPDEVHIVTRDSVDLVNAIKTRQLSASQVTAAFCKTAAIAHQINNCLHEIFFEQAIEHAGFLDDFLATNREPIGPLHGLPISLKDQFHVGGVDTAMGYVGHIGSNLGIRDPSETHKIQSQITKDLLSMGAVLYCKTSLPQTLFFGETKNNIIGQTLNPANRNLSCGGSSGGEGALQALNGSCLGVGTDIGGSVRIPASFNSIFALKPTPQRVSYRDVANTTPGQTTYPSAVGFMSTSIGGLDLIFKSLLSKQPWLSDPAVVPIPYRQDVMNTTLLRANKDGTAKSFAKPLKLGIMWNDGMVTPHAPVARGLEMVVEAVKQAGHKVVVWNPPSHFTARKLHLSVLLADGGHDVHGHLKLSGEPIIPDLEKLFALKPPMNLLDYQKLTLDALKFEESYSDYWNSTAKDDGQIVDAVIMPVAPHAAVIPGRFYHTSYTSVINLMNFSTAVIPVTKADKTIDIPDPNFCPLGPEDKMNWDAYDGEMYHGGPVGIQLVARKFEEEKVLGIAKIVSAALETASKPKAGVSGHETTDQAEPKEDGRTCLVS